MLGNLTKALSVACLLFFCNNVNAEFKDWNKTDKILFGTYVGLNVIDVGQTFDIIECQKQNPSCNFMEENRLLGSHPSKGKVLIYKTALTGLSYLALDNSPPIGRRGALLVINVVMLAGVIDNHNVGLRFNIRF